MPVGIGACAMNKICWYVESQLDGYKSQLHHDSTFDYNCLKVKRRVQKNIEKLYMILNKNTVNVLRSIKQTGLPTKNNQIITENIYAKNLGKRLLNFAQTMKSA